MTIEISQEELQALTDALHFYVFVEYSDDSLANYKVMYPDVPQLVFESLLIRLRSM
jgi:hypothetical protein